MKKLGLFQSDKKDASKQQKKFKESDFIFCLNQNTFSGIVMLINQQSIVDKILKDAVEPYYFWIYERTEKVDSMLWQISSEVRERSCIFSTVQLMKKYISQQNFYEHKKIVLIAPPEMEEEMYIMLRKKIIFRAVLYYWEDDSETDSNNEYENEEKQFQATEFDRSSKIVKCKTKTSLKILFSFNQWTFGQEVQFPNFVMLKEEAEKSTKLYRVINAMINQETGKQCRKQILTELVKLINLLGKFHPKISISFGHILDELEIMKQRQLKCQEIIKIYSSEQHRIYVLLNSFLRGLSCPTEVYYIQPIVKELCSAIRMQTKAQNDFVSYRGGFIEEQELLKIYSNVGEIIQNLGFLSTSQSLEAAMRFEVNIIFQIVVKLSQSQNGGNGFANISTISNFKEEQEILFNPTNYFKVVQFIEETISIKGKFTRKKYIILEFIALIEIGSEDDEQSTQATKILLQIHSEMSKNESNQANVILKAENCEQLQKAKLYFSFYNRKAFSVSDMLHSIVNPSNNLMASTYENENGNYASKEGTTETLTKDPTTIKIISNYLFALNIMIISLQISHQYEFALDLCQIQKQLCESVFLQNNLIYSATLNTMIKCYKFLQRPDEAQKMYNIVSEIMKKVKRKINRNSLKMLNGFGVVLKHLKLVDQALEVWQQCLINRKSVLGNMHPETLSTLFNIGIIYSEKGEYLKSYAMLIECEKYQKQILGERNISYLKTLDSLSIIYYELGKYKEAVEIQKKCIYFKKIGLGEKHIEYLRSLYHLAIALCSVHRYQEALEFQTKIQEIFQEGQQQNYDIYLAALSIKVFVLFRTSKRQNAIQLNLNIWNQLLICKNFLSKQSFAFNLWRVGENFKQIGKLTQGLKIISNASLVLKDVFGETHPLYLTSLRSIGEICLYKRQYETALQYLKSNLQIQRKILGDKHPKLLDTMYFLGEVYQKIGKLSEALSINQKCLLSTQEGEFSSRSKYTKYIIQLINIKKKLGKAGEVLFLLKKAIKTEKEGIFLNSAALLYLSIGKMEEAVSIVFKISSLFCNELPSCLKILVRVYRLTIFIYALQKYVEHLKKEQVKTLFYESQKSYSMRVAAYQQIVEQLSNKRRTQLKRVKQANSYLFFR